MSHSHAAGSEQQGLLAWVFSHKEYWVIFVLLALLTVLEVWIAMLRDETNATAVAIGLCLMAVAKAALVFLFYMHMKHETKVLKLTVAIPLAMPVIYAFVLIAEVYWRLANGAAGHLQ